MFIRKSLTRRLLEIVAVVLVLGAKGCGPAAASSTPHVSNLHGVGRAVWGGQTATQRRLPPRVRGRRALAAGPIQHVVVIVQENRTVDNLFQAFPGADTQSYTMIGGTRHDLVPLPINVPFDPRHSHEPAFVTEFNGGSNDGWLKETFHCKGGQTMCAADGATALAYVDPTSARPYYDIASQFILADEVLQANEGPSFPAHQYLIAAQSGGAEPNQTWGFAENGAQDGNYSCASASAIARINMASQYPGVEGSATQPCGNYTTLMDELDTAGISWKYYVHSPTSLWAAPNSIGHLYGKQADRNDVVTPETNVLSDIANCTLPQVAYVTPSFSNSDHPMGTGPNSPYWPASIINAIGNTQQNLACNYWQNTVVLVTWDDWGGWFDHVLPQHPGFDATDPYEVGYRTPLLVVSAYDRAQTPPFIHVDHTQRTNMSILHFIEDVYGVPQMTLLDASTDDLFGDLCLNCPAAAFTPINMHGHHIAGGQIFHERETDIDG